MKILKGLIKNFFLFLLIIPVLIPVLFNLFCTKSEKAAAKTVVVFTVGNVELQRGGNQPVQLKVPDIINAGDIIKTGDKSNVVLQVEERDVIRIQENSLVKISELFATGSLKIFVNEGQVLAKVSRLKKDESFKIATPTAVASVRGTEFSVSFREGKGLVSVREGKVAVGTKKLSEADIIGEMNLSAEKVKVAEKEEPAVQETIIEKGNTAIIEQKIETPSKEETAAKEGAKVEVRLLQMTKVEDLAIQKISEVQMISNPEKKTAEEIKEIQKPLIEKEQKIDEEIKSIEATPVETLSIQDLQKKYGILSVVRTKDGKEYTGAFSQKGDEIKVITVRGTIVINPADIKKISKYK